MHVILLVFVLVVWYVIDPFTFQWSAFTLASGVLAVFFGRFAYVEWRRVPRKPRPKRRYYE